MKDGRSNVARLVAPAVLLSVAVAVLASAAWPTARSAAQPTAPFCRPGVQPSFVFGFRALADAIGDTMGEPLECEHANPENGDTLQRTTTGLAFYRKATNTPTFTDGFRHWALTTAGLVFWTGLEVDPPAMTDLALQPPASGEGPARVLLVTATAGYRHSSIETARAIVPTLGDASGTYRVTLLAETSDLPRLTAALLAEHDLVLFANTSGELPLDDAQRRALLGFVARGGGFVGTHSATDTFYQWPAYGQMLGAYFREHPWVQEARVVVEDPAHPAASHLGDGFWIHEEFYVFRANPRPGVHVLLSLDAASVGAAGDYPLAWCAPYGAGRVGYTALGHFERTWTDPRFQQHLLGLLQWAAGRVAGDCGPPARPLT